MANSKQFVNPFHKGVTYPVFVQAMGRKGVKTYCKDHLTNDEIDWIEVEIRNYKKNK